MGAFGSGAITEEMKIVYAVFDWFFVASIVKNFTTEYKADGMSKPVRDIKKIAIRYIHNEFLRDLILVFPFYTIFGGDESRNAKVWLFIKSFRMLKGIKIFNVSEIISRIQSSRIEAMQEKIKKQP